MTEDSRCVEDELSKLHTELARRPALDARALASLLGSLFGGLEVRLFVRDSDGVFANTANSMEASDTDETPFSATENKAIDSVLGSAAPLPIFVWPADLAEHYALRGRVGLPLAHGSRVLGFLLLTCDSRDFSRSLSLVSITALSMLVAVGISSQEAQAIFDTDLEIARHVQGHLLPRGRPVLSQIDYFVISTPARGVSGDFHDHVSSSSDRLDVVIGDVSGKGIGAALLMASILPSLRAVMGDRLSIEETMLRFYECVYDASPDGSYASMFYGVFDFERSTLRYVNAGHQPAPLLFRRRRPAEIEELSIGGFLLGLFREPKRPFKVGKKALMSGDTIICATDGVTDAIGTDGQMFGEERFKQEALDLVRRNSSAEELVSSLHAAVCDHVSGGRQSDDITISAFVLK